MARNIRKVAVIGSGVMGGGIVSLLASIGIKVLLLDIVPPDLTNSELNDDNAKNRIVKNGIDRILSSNPPLLTHSKAINLIEIGNLNDDFYKISNCDWIIEVVVENLKVKKNLLSKIEGIRKEGSIVSSNTSGIPLSSMTEHLSLEFRQHFLGTHFFNPVRYMKLLELIPGKDTLPEILEFISNFGKAVLGKGIVWGKDTPNFIGNRIGIHGVVNTMQLMIKYELTIPEVDTLFGPSMGRPKTGIFKTSDLVGLDILSNVAQNTYDLAHSDESRDSFVLPDFVIKMIEKKYIGKKAQSGFYKVEFDENWNKIRKVIDINTLKYIEYQRPRLESISEVNSKMSLEDKIRTLISGDDKFSNFVWEAVVSNLIYSANRIPEISDNIVQIDNAMKWGFNLEFGPFEMWDIIGLEKSIDRMKSDGFLIPDSIQKMISDGNKVFYKLENGASYFFDFLTNTYKKISIDNNIISLSNLKKKDRTVKACNSASLIDLGDNIYCIEFHTKMNAINGEIVDFMEECIDDFIDDGIGLVIGNQTKGLPGTFSAGGDLSFMLKLAKQKKYSEIESFLKKAQDCMQMIRYSNIPVVAAPYGLALGGGCELCLGTADRIVAHTDLYMGLVEVGVGLLPSGGGCLNLWKKISTSISESVIDFDLSKFFIPAFMAIAMAKISTSADDSRHIGFLGPNDRIVSNRDYLVNEAKKEALRILEDGYFPSIKVPLKVFGEAAIGMINTELFNMKSGKFITEYDAFLANRIAFVMCGGEVRSNSFIDENVILTLEREAFVDFWKEKKTIDRVEHMLKTGKPLRN